MLPEAPTVLVGTANRHKVEEIRAALEGLTLPDGRQLAVAGAERLPQGEPVEETGSTFEENAAIKARAYALRASRLSPDRRPRWVIADDSGLLVDALGGEPGVLSARYAGEGSSDEENNRKLLRALERVKAARRDARFVCVIACAEVSSGDGPGADIPLPSPEMPPVLPEVPVVFQVRGECMGRILTEPRGTGGFGYDPLFFFPALGKTFAELSQAEKNLWSHRGKAVRLLREALSDHLRGGAGGSAAHGTARRESEPGFGQLK